MIKVEDIQASLNGIEIKGAWHEEPKWERDDDEGKFVADLEWLGFDVQPIHPKLFSPSEMSEILRLLGLEPGASTETKDARNYHALRLAVGLRIENIKLRAELDELKASHRG
jgi:hypothetical protein